MQIQEGTQTALWKEGKWQGFKRQSTKYNPCIQMKDFWLGLQGLISSNVQIQGTKLQEK